MFAKRSAIQLESIRAPLCNFTQLARPVRCQRQAAASSGSIWPGCSRIIDDCATEQSAPIRPQSPQPLFGAVFSWRPFQSSKANILATAGAIVGSQAPTIEPERALPSPESYGDNLLQSNVCLKRMKRQLGQLKSLNLPNSLPRMSNVCPSNWAQAVREARWAA